jgi:hypothetical protein
LVWLIHPTSTIELEGQQDSILPAITTALATTTQLLGKLHNVCLTGWLKPVLNKERLRIASPVFKLLLCRCDEANDASRLGNNEIKPLKQIGPNNVTKNRTLIYQSQTNLIEQRTTANAGMVHGFIWNKEEQGDGADV